MAVHAAKRQRLLDAARAPAVEEAGGHEDEEEAEALPTDVALCLQLVLEEARHKWPHLPPCVPCDVLAGMLADRTALERGLDEMCRAHELRRFKLSTGADEHGVMRIADYVSIIDAAAAAACRCSQGEAGRAGAAGGAAQCSASSSGAHSEACQVAQAAARAFTQGVVASHTDVHIGRGHLARLLAAGWHAPASAAGPSPQGQGQCGGGHARAGAAGHHAPPGMPDADSMVSALLNLGALSRHPSDMDAFLMHIPGIGPYVKSLAAGRKELLRFVSRKPHKEVREEALLPLRLAAPQQGGRSTRKAAGGASPGLQLRSSVLGTAFHVRDLLGKGLAERVRTPAGSFIRCTSPS